MGPRQSLHTVRGRLARFLLEHAEGERGAEAGAATVFRRWTQEEIAAQIGTVREVVARTLRASADAGLLRIEGHRMSCWTGRGWRWRQSGKSK